MTSEKKGSARHHPVGGFPAEPIEEPRLFQTLAADRKSDGLIKAIREGDVLRADGYEVRLYNLIKRLWGWPGKAARMASDHLRENLPHPAIYVVTDRRVAQQLDLLYRVPGLMDALVRGLAGGATREAFVGHMELEHIDLTFSEPLSDDGLVSDIIDTVGRHLALNDRDMRDRVRVTYERPGVDVEIKL